MVKNEVITLTKYSVLFTLLAYVLTGCTGLKNTSQGQVGKEVVHSLVVEVLPTLTATSTAQIQPSKTPDLIRPDTIREAYNQESTRIPGRSTATPEPSPIPSLSTEQLCKPFPESIQYLGSTQILGFPAWTIRGRCQGEVTYFRSPVGEMALYDYSSLTGRFTYGSPDSSENGLWVYDYWTELSEKWLDESISQAAWAKVKNAQDLQKLGILTSDGILYIASGPFQMYPISDNVSSFSIGPTGNRLAFVKDHSLYVVGINGGQPRKLANDVNGSPEWARDGNAIIVPGSPIKIAKLDGSGSFTPQELPSVLSRIGYLCEGLQNCRFPTDKVVDRILWNERSNLLVFYSSSPTEEVNYRTLYVYELSEDLRRIVNFQRILGDFTGQITWDILGESLIDSRENKVKISPPQEFFFTHARINTMSEHELGVEFTWMDSWSTSDFGHHFTKVVVTDQVLVLDIDGNATTLDTVTTGMIVKLTARKLNPYTLSLFAYTIQVYCDQIPCYLGFEGRS